MLRIEVPISPEGWDEEKQEFVEPETKVLELEHSLVSLSKWESKWCTPFESNEQKTTEQVIDYIKCMTLTKNVNPDVYNHLTSENQKQIQEYIAAPMTATTIRREGNVGRGSREKLTAEILYFYMISYGIPFECQKWHLNRLITLIRVCGIRNGQPTKMGKGEVLRNNAALNAARRKQFNTRG